MSISFDMPTLHASPVHALHTGQNGCRINCFTKKKRRKIIFVISCYDIFFQGPKLWQVVSSIFELLVHLKQSTFIVTALQFFRIYSYMCVCTKKGNLAN